MFGTPQTCLATVDRLGDLGVDEIACLIDFGVDAADNEAYGNLIYFNGWEGRDVGEGFGMPGAETPDKVLEIAIGRMMRNSPEKESMGCAKMARWVGPPPRPTVPPRP